MAQKPSPKGKKRVVLKPCAGCGTKFDASAAVCPNCRQRRPAQAASPGSKRITALVVVAVTLIIVQIALALLRREPALVSPPQDVETVWDRCAQLIEETVGGSGTVRYPIAFLDHVKELAYREYEVAVPIDVESGGVVRERYNALCVLHYDDLQQDWAVDELELTPP